MKNYLLFYLTAIFLFSACNSHEIQDQDEMIPTTTAEHRSVCNIPPVTKTDIDQIGKGHNELLEAAITIMSSTNGVLPTSDIQQIFRQLNIPNAIISDSNIEVNLENYYFNAIDDVKNNPPIEFLTSVADLNQIYINSANFSEISELIDIKIQEIDIDLSMDSDKKLAIMGFFTVGKYSAEFWLPISAGGSGIGYSYLQSIGGVTGNDDTISALSIAEADALGAAGGMLRWCGAAVLGGPVGVGGFIGGAIFGGAYASATAAP